MNDQLENNEQSPDQKPRIEPIGAVILGSVDPKTLDNVGFKIKSRF